MILAMLNKGSLTFKNIQSFLEAVKLCCAAGLAFFISVRLSDTTVVKLGKVLENRIMLGACGSFIAAQIALTFGQTLQLLALVLDILLFDDFVVLVVLCHLLVLSLCICLHIVSCGQTRCKVGLHNLQGAEAEYQKMTLLSLLS